MIRPDYFETVNRVVRNLPLTPRRAVITMHLKIPRMQFRLGRNVSKLTSALNYFLNKTLFAGATPTKVGYSLRIMVSSVDHTFQLYLTNMLRFLSIIVKKFTYSDRLRITSSQEYQWFLQRCERKRNGPAYARGQPAAPHRPSRKYIAVHQAPGSPPVDYNQRRYDEEGQAAVYDGPDTEHRDRTPAAWVQT